MTGGRPSDLVRQMRLLVAEEEFLCQLTGQVTEYYGGDTRVVHGPWRAGDCQQVLLRWFDCGLIDCIATSWAAKVRSDEVVHFEYDADWRSRATEYGQHLILAREDARALLSDASTWRTEGPGAGVKLCESGQGHGLPFGDWFAALTGLPDAVIIEQQRSGAASQRPWAEPEIVGTAGLWVQAVQNAERNGGPILCPVNEDAYLTVDWGPSTSDTAAGESVTDVVCFIDQGRTRQVPRPRSGRHRLSCPSCGAERYVVVTRNPG